MACILALVASIPLVAALPSPHSGHRFDWSSTRALLAFGDSYTYVQGTHGHQNFSFIGDLFNYAYDAQTLFSDMIVQNQTGTAEGGPNWIEHLTGCGLREGFTSPSRCERELWDFAFAGADISTNTPRHHNFTVSLEEQVTQYTEYGHKPLSDRLSTHETLVAIWIGINDVGDSAHYTTVDYFPTFYNALMTTLFDSVDKLYGLGFRSYLFFNLPPMDRDPSNLVSSDPSPNVTQVEWYNDAVAQHAESFGKKYADTNVMLFDAHARLSAILDDPAPYGIRNTTNFCAGYDQPDIYTNYRNYGCPTPLDTYFWYDSGHMTSHVHAILARELGEWLEKQS
ncbi:uncharacterized protein PFLUO_LOCUS3862 [Penicillium psychrofluorescens]|uniref:uncharacterized protein n=1 Tax=Penicillium psychrofluorescens TaxID=3158075 RepID=UPI003CCD6694